jgi:hypothetical protein
VEAYADIILVDYRPMISILTMITTPKDMAVTKKCIMMASMLISLYLSHYIVLTVWGHGDCVDTLFAAIDGLWVTILGPR